MTTSTESDNRRSDRISHLRRSRHRRFAVAAVVVSLLPFVLIEIVVRAVWTPPSSVDLTPTRQGDLFVRDGDRFRIDSERLNFFCPASFAAEKPNRTRRIFVLGGSTTQGRPFATETAFSTWLGLRLNHAGDDHDYEIVNVGGVSYASYRVSKILDEVLRHDADAIVLYTGHNEFLEDRTYARAKQETWFGRTVAEVATRWKTAQFLRTRLIDQEVVTFSAEVDTILDHPDGLDAYVPDDAWRTRIEFEFAQTLDRMIDAAKKASVPMIVCTPASDIVATPPFKSALLPNDAPEPAKLYAIGRTKWDRGDSSGAKELLVQARDTDVCPLRATTPIIDAVKSAEGIVVDIESVLDEQNSRGQRIADGVADPKFFADHVHPTIAGHQCIASAIAKRFGELGWYVESEAAEAAYLLAAKSHLESLDETYYARGEQRLAGLKRWAAGRAATPLADDDVPE